MRAVRSDGAGGSYSRRERTRPARLACAGASRGRARAERAPAVRDVARVPRRSTRRSSCASRANYGSVARFKVRDRSVFLVTDPAGVKHVLQDNADNYGRKTRSVEALRETLGNGLLTTTGPSWWRNRRLAQPSFHKQRLARLRGHHGGVFSRIRRRASRARAPAAPRSTSCRVRAPHAAHPRALPVRARSHRRGRRRRRRARCRPSPHDREAGGAVSAAGHRADARRTCASARRCARSIGWCCR